MGEISKPESRAMAWAESIEGASDGYICELYHYCSIGCKYCRPEIRTYNYDGANHSADTILRVRKWCSNNPTVKGPILLGFNSDPYMILPKEENITREVLEIFAREKKHLRIMTKGGMRAFDDFGIIKENGWEFATSLVWTDMLKSEVWEPGAATPQSRMKAVMEAHHAGIKQRMHIEPVIDPDQALAAAMCLLDYVDDWTVAMPHGRVDNKVVWPTFLKRIKEVLAGKNVVIRPPLRGMV